jgi:hypothetical protein
VDKKKKHKENGDNKTQATKDSMKQKIKKKILRNRADKGEERVKTRQNNFKFADL